MAKGLTIQVEGLDKLQKRLGQIPPKVITKTDATLKAVADDFLSRAVDEVPVDEGRLKGSLTVKKNGVMDYEVVADSPIAAFIEFGTGRRAEIPADLQGYAAQFRGKTAGSGQGFYDAILAWVKRKGITGTYNVATRRREGSKVERQIEDEQVAFAIYLSILRHGIHAHPFFFKQMPAAQTQLDQELSQIVAEALK